jgi:hypothetical protein
MLRKIHGINFFHIKFWVALTLNTKMDQRCPQLRFFISMVRLYNVFACRCECITFSQTTKCGTDSLPSALYVQSTARHRLYKTVKFYQWIFNLIQFTIKHRFDWKYLTVSTKLSCCCPYNSMTG